MNTSGCLRRGCRQQWSSQQLHSYTPAHMRTLLPPAPPCLQGNTDPLEQAVAKLQRTKRPDRADLAALLPELQVASQ